MPVYRRIDKELDDTPRLPPKNGYERSLLRWGEPNHDAYTVWTAPSRHNLCLLRVYQHEDGQKLIDHKEAPNISMTTRLLVWRIFNSREKVKKKLTKALQKVQEKRKTCFKLRSKMCNVNLRPAQMHRLEDELAETLSEFSDACHDLIEAYSYWC